VKDYKSEDKENRVEWYKSSHNVLGRLIEPMLRDFVLNFFVGVR
jgi:hypothetical protein